MVLAVPGWFCWIGLAYVEPVTETSNTGTGRMLLHLRTTLNLTIREAAAATHSSASYWTNAENGKVTPKPLWVANVIDALGALVQDAA